MSPTLAKKLIRYRNLAVALANAGITWIILIIAPLGLFAVISCTIGVFISSLVFGIVGDYLLINLLESDRTFNFRQRLHHYDIQPDDSREIPQQSDRTFNNQSQQGKLPDKDF